MSGGASNASVPWTRLLVAVLPAFLVSRLVLVAIVLVVEAIGLPWARFTYAADPLLAGLTGEDAPFYLGIAAEGYHLDPVRLHYPDWVFFPGFPLLTRIAAVATLGNIALAGVLVANIALLVALLLIARIVTAEAGLRTARWTAWLVVFAPGAVAFGWAYGDSLLLLASAGGLLAARHRRWWLLAACTALAVATRLPGLLLVIPFGFEVWRQEGRRFTRHHLALLAGPLALGVFAAYQGAVLGDPLAFVHGQAAWDIPSVVDAEAGGGYGTADGSVPGYVLAMVGLLLGTLLAYTAMLPGLVRSKLPRAEVLIALVAFATVFLSGRLQSDARYLAVGWPFAWFLASRRGRWPAVWLAVSVVAFVVYGFLNVSQLMAP
jgi:hypothetical protein